MDPVKKSKTQTTTTRKPKKKPDKGKQPMRLTVQSPTEDLRLAKRKRKKGKAEPVNVGDDLRIARESWMSKDQDRWAEERTRADKRMLKTLQGRGEEREQPPEAGPMPLAVDLRGDPSQSGTQHMVASARDLMDIKALQELRPDVYGKLTVNQVWALVAAERKGELQHEQDMIRSRAKLAELNKTYGTTYDEDDLPIILKTLRERRLASNFFFTIPPGRNREQDKGGDSLLDVLISDEEGRFRNVWETGTSQASTNLAARGGAEERFGYAAALKRTEGIPLDIFLGGKFATEPTGAPIAENDTSPAAMERRRLQEQFPNYLQPREMPKYGAAVGPSQAFGVSARYGSSVVYWKSDIDWRTTRCPGDSWSNDFLQSGMAYVSANYPESVFAYTEPDIARLAAAEATDFKHDGKLAKQVAQDGGNLSAYIEAQIHGDLSWRDVDVVVLNYGTFGMREGNLVVTREEVEKDARKLMRFAEKNGYGFTVRIGSEHSA